MNFKLDWDRSVNQFEGPRQIDTKLIVVTSISIGMENRQAQAAYKQLIVEIQGSFARMTGLFR